VVLEKTYYNVGQGRVPVDSTKFDRRFFESTRGRVVTLLRGGTRSVEELAGQLDLTDNAVRAHLLTLERDGLVRHRGGPRPPRKPHFTYSLTQEAERLFPKAYDLLLNQLIAALKCRLSQEEVDTVLREVGRNLAADVPSDDEDDLPNRVRSAIKVLEAIGGAAEAEQHGDKIVIKSSGCPLAAAVATHPEVCMLAETLIAEVVKSSVKEHCNREGPPQCRFEIAVKN
jgi:predicted ArsR family transcriptional regulator